MEETKKKKDKTSIKKMLGGFLALVLVAVVSIVGTLAYLGRTTGNTVTNTFTGSDDISVGLTEEDWEDSGSAKAEHYTPGLKIEKDPTIRNTSSGTDNSGDYNEWVAIRVDYLKGNYDDEMSAVVYGDFVGASGVVSSLNDEAGDPIASFAGRNWLKVTPKANTTEKFDIFVYKTCLAKNASTNSLFESVTINQNIAKVNNGETSGSANYKEKYPKFEIKVLGAAIKNETEFFSGNGSSTSITSSKLDYANFDANSTDCIIMDELVKLLTDDTEYTAFTGKTAS